MTERLAASTLGLPFAVDMTGGEVDRVAGALARKVAPPAFRAMVISGR
jgi:hypothetical protein